MAQITHTFTQITKNFTLEELYASDTAKRKGIDNTPTRQAIVNLTHLAVKVLQPLRSGLKEPISISSGYRCPALNRAVGGVSNSQHMTGEAADINIDGDMAKGKRIFDYIRRNLPFDQLIWEHNKAGVYWVHVSYCKEGNRGQVIENLLKSTK